MSTAWLVGVADGYIAISVDTARGKLYTTNRPENKTPLLARRKGGMADDGELHCQSGALPNAATEQKACGESNNLSVASFVAAFCSLILAEPFYFKIEVSRSMMFVQELEE